MLQLRHSLDSALPPSCHLRPFACHWSQFLSGFGACMQNSCQRKQNEHLCSTCASSFNWVHRAVNDPIGQTTVRFLLGLHSSHLPLKHSWTLKRSCDNLLHFTKDLVQCFHLAPTSSTPLTIPTDLSAIPEDNDTFYNFPYLLSGLWILFYSPSPLLFVFSNFLNMLSPSPFSQQKIKNTAIWQNKGNTHIICLKTGKISLEVSITWCQSPADCWDKWCSVFTDIGQDKKRRQTEMQCTWRWQNVCPFVGSSVLKLHLHWIYCSLLSHLTPWHHHQEWATSISHLCAPKRPLARSCGH